MAGYYDPYGRSRPSQRRTPTLEDFQTLTQAYQKLQEQHQSVESLLQQTIDAVSQNADRVKQLERELEIKNDALRQQGQALKETESELVWTRAALKQQGGVEEADDTTWKERFQRLQADFDNVRKRSEQRFENELSSERNKILLDMLPLADHLDMALAHAGALESDQAQQFLENINATRHAFQETLKSYGVQRIEAENAPFDPNQHEAVGQIPSQDVPEDHVAQVIQPGYMDSARLLRPARVLVSSGTAEEDADRTESEGDNGV